MLGARVGDFTLPPLLRVLLCLAVVATEAENRAAAHLRGQSAPGNATGDADILGNLTSEAVGNCRLYGCVGYTRSHSCQCNAECASYRSCCEDYTSTCEAPSSASCRAYGCGEYVQSHLCQCNAECVRYKNCCTDFRSTCASPAPGPVPGPAPAPAPGPAPKPPPSPGRVYGHPSPSKVYPKYQNFTLTLVEEFDSPLNLNTDPIWTWSDGGLSEGQVRFVEEAIKFEGGVMKVVASERQYPTQACSDAEVATIDPKPLTSGELRTKYNMFRYGRYEVSMKAPEVQPGDSQIDGNYISTMFAFRDAKYKHWREIDFELTGASPTAVTTNVLSADGTPAWKAGIQEDKETSLGFNSRAAFHTYAFEWLPDRVTWYIDGEVARQKTKAAGGVRIPDLSAKIMMNLWIFDKTLGFGGKEIQNNRYPMSGEYDWFRFYKWDGDAQYPCTGLGTQCLTADDRYLSKNNPCDGVPQVGTVYGKQPCVTSTAGCR